MKADPSAQQRLLELQAIDTTLTQLAHRRAHLPELAELARLAEEHTGLRQERTAAQVDVDDLDHEIARIEREVEQIRARKERNADRLASGVGPARELEAISHEVESLNRRQSDLEDNQLELMERREQAQAVLDRITSQVTASEERTGEVEARRDAALAEISQQEAEQNEARKPLVGELPDDLVTLYERIRSDTGVGAALLQGGRCGGCRLELSGSDRARIRAAAPDEVVRCEECRRILVRTAESGL